MDDAPRAVLLAVAGGGLALGAAAFAIAWERPRGVVILVASLAMVPLTYATALSIGAVLLPSTLFWLLSALSYTWDRREGTIAQAGLAGVVTGTLGLVSASMVLLAVVVAGYWFSRVI